MTAVSWKSSVSGNWSTGSNWSTGTKPGASDDVTISVTTASTITYSSGTDVVASLDTNSLATLAVTGGMLSVRGSATLYGNVTESAGTFVLGPTSYAGGTISQTGGTLQVAAGMLQLAGSDDSFAGTLAGAGVNFSSGSDTIAAGAVVTANALEFSGATVNFGESLAYGGAFQITSGTIALGGNTLTLGGNVALDGGAASGAGTIVSSTVSTIGNFYLTGNTVLSNTGTMTQSNYIYVGYYGTDTAQLQNQAGATLNLLANSTIYGAVGGELINAGTLAKGGGGGASTVYVNTVSTGTITVATGTIAFDGASDSFSGSLGGAGTVAFSSGSDTLASGLSLSAGAVQLNGAVVTLGRSLSYAGNWLQTSGSLALGGETLNLSGGAALLGGTVTGSGTLKISGGTELSNAVFSSSASIGNSGTITQTGYVYDGYYGTDTDKISNYVGATFDIAGDYAIYASLGASFVNAGTLIKSADAGAATINAALSSTGTITIGQGTLTLNGAGNVLKGAIGGAGTLNLASGTDAINAGAVLGSAHLRFSGATVTLGTNIACSKDFAMSSGTLALGGYKFNLATASLEGGVIDGAGTVGITKTALLSTNALEGTAMLSNSGTATISNYTYIGYNSNDTAQFINGATATLSLIANAQIYTGGASSITNSGTLVKSSGGGTSIVSPSVTSTGTITVSAGTLRLSGSSNSLGGTINGVGMLELNAGADSIAARATLSVGSVLLDGANVTLAGATTISGQFDQTTGTLLLGGQTLTLTGAATFEGGTAAGSGTIQGNAVTTAYSLALEGSTSFSNTGSLVDTNVIYCGYYGSDTATLINQASGTVQITGNGYIATGGASSFSNAGLLIKSGGNVSTVSPSFTNTGSIALSDGTLRLAGTTNSLAGTISGAGTLELIGGADTATALTLTAGALLLDGANLDLAANLVTAAAFTQTTGTLALGGETMTLNGVASLDGGIASGSGKLAVDATAEVSNYFLEGSTQLTNGGSITVAAGTTLNVGYNTSDTAALKNFVGGTIDLLGGSRIGAGGAATFANAGTVLADGAGQKTISPATTNTGVMEVRQGTLAFQGTVGGGGSFTLDLGTQLTFAGATSGGTVNMGLDSTLGISTTAGFTDIIAGFAAGDVIALNGFGYNTNAPPTLAFNATTDKLTVTDGATGFVLDFTGSYSAGSFLLVNDQGTVGITHT